MVEGLENRLTHMVKCTVLDQLGFCGKLTVFRLLLAVPVETSGYLINK